MLWDKRMRGVINLPRETSSRWLPGTLAPPMSLLETPHRKTVVVEEVGGDRGFRRRLMEMGLVPGTEVRIIAVAPMGDPLTIELRASRMSIRKREAALVMVRDA